MGERPSSGSPDFSESQTINPEIDTPEQKSGVASSALVRPELDVDGSTEMFDRDFAHVNWDWDACPLGRPPLYGKLGIPDMEWSKAYVRGIAGQAGCLGSNTSNHQESPSIEVDRE